MNTDLFEFDDWGTFIWRGLLIVGAVALGVFVVVTLGSWLHNVISEPVLSRTTTAIFTQPRTASEWLTLSLVLGVFFGLGALALGSLVLCIGAVLAILGQGLEARRVCTIPIADLSSQARRAADSGIRGGDSAT